MGAAARLSRAANRVVSQVTGQLADQAAWASRTLLGQHLPGAALPGLQVRAVHRGVSPHALGPEGLLASRGAELLRLTPTATGAAQVHHLGAPPQQGGQPVAGVPWAGPALRLGVHIARDLPGGDLLAITSGVCWRGEAVGPAGGERGYRWSQTLHFSGFRKPARRGVLVEGARVWLAQYDLNRDRSRVIRLWRSDDAARTFAELYRFAPGEVRHIHFIQRDPFSGDLWLGTGDRDDESGLFRSSDDGVTWAEVARGSQRYRAIALAFTADAVIWGTDAGSDAGHYRNRALRLDRVTGQISETCWLQGPVHGVTATPSGGVLLTTGLEGGVNERDRRVHIWHSESGSDWREVASFARGLQPRRVQYAVAHFPTGQGAGLPDGSPHKQAGDTIWLGLRGVFAGDVLTLEATLRP